MEKGRLLVNKSYLLEKYPGKGGWTYAAIPEVVQDKHAHFGWVKVKGSIDGFEFSDYRLMPMGNGKLFLPVRAEIRKKIGKKEGDFVNIVLYADDAPPVIPEDFLLCLKEDSLAYGTFMKCNDSEQKAITDWIFAVKNDDIKVDRIAKALNMLAKGEMLIVGKKSREI